VDIKNHLFDLIKDLIHVSIDGNVNTMNWFKNG